jgi:hypothetical protein
LPRSHPRVTQTKGSWHQDGWRCSGAPRRPPARAGGTQTASDVQRLPCFTMPGVGVWKVAPAEKRERRLKSDIERLDLRAVRAGRNLPRVDSKLAAEPLCPKAKPPRRAAGQSFSPCLSDNIGPQHKCQGKVTSLLNKDRYNGQRSINKEWSPARLTPPACRCRYSKFTGR